MFSFIFRIFESSKHAVHSIETCPNYYVLQYLLKFQNIEGALQVCIIVFQIPTRKYLNLYFYLKKLLSP